MQKLKNSFTKSILALTIFLTAVTFVVSLLIVNNNNKMLLDYSGRYKYSSITCITVIIGVFFIGILFKWMFKLFDKISNKCLNILPFILFAFYIIIQAVIMFNFIPVPSTDSFMVQDQSLAITMGLDKVIDASGYFGRYANNNIMVILLSYYFGFIIKLGITDYYLASIVLNFLLLLAAEVLFYLGVKKLMGKRFACKYLAISVMNPIMYITTPWVYSISFCMPFMAGVFYLGICIFKQKNSYYLAAQCCGFAALTVIGYFIRPVVAIIAIGFITCGFLWISKNRQKLIKSAVAIICCGVVFLTVKFGMDSLLSVYYKDESDNYPLTHWLMMGLHGNGAVNSQDQNYTNSFETKEEKQAANIKEIKATLRSYGITGLFTHFIEKQYYTWSDGSAGYVWRLVQTRGPTMLYQYLAGDKTDAFMLYCQIFRAALYGFALISMLKQLFNKKKSTLFLPVITLFGAMAFYIVWEAKQSYCIPFLFLFVILAADGVQRSDFNFKKVKLNRYANVLMRIVSVAMVAVTLLIMAIRFNDFTEKKSEFKDVSFYCNNSSSIAHAKNIAQSGGILKQQFYVDKSFNTIELKASSLSGDAVYCVEIKDANNNVIYKNYVDKTDLHGGHLNLNLTQVNPVKNTQYVLSITGDGNSDSIDWIYYHSKVLDMYAGDLRLNNKTINGDTALSVYRSYMDTYTTPLRYNLCCLLILSIESALCLTLFLKRKEKKLSVDKIASNSL